MASEKTISAIQATFVSRARPGRNFNGAAKMWADDDNYSMLYWKNPFPRGATILSAYLELRNADSWTAGVTTTLHWPTAMWSASRVNWNNKPGVSGQAGSVSYATARGANSVMRIDIKGALQAVANGTPWRGFQLRSSHTSDKAFWSDKSPRANLRPKLVVRWSMPPNQPTGLLPNGDQVVSSGKPGLKWRFTDVDGSSKQTEYEIQIAATESFAGAWSQIKASSDTVCDLNTTTYPGLAEGSTAWWRVRVRDDSGLWSPFSAGASFTYVAQGTLVVDDPRRQKELLRNLVANGSFENTSNAIAYWNPVRCTIAADTSWAEDGGASGRIQVTDASSTPYVFATGEGPQAGRVSPTVFGDYVSARVRVRASRPGRTRMTLQGYDAANGFTQALVGGVIDVDFAAAGEEKTIEIKNALVGHANTTAILPILYLYSSGGLPATLGEHIKIDGLIVVNHGQEPGTHETLEYFNGDTPDTYNNEYAWLGTPHASSSVRYNDAYIGDPSPMITWTFTPPAGYVQEAFQVVVEEQDGDVVHDSGIVQGEDNSYQLPQATLRTQNQTYDIIVRVIDNVDNRVTVPGVSAWLEDQVGARYDREGALPPIKDLTVTKPADGLPYRLLRWTSAEEVQDSFTIHRTHVQTGQKVRLTSVTPLAVQVAHNTVTGVRTYEYKDWFVPLRAEYSWQVQMTSAGDSAMSNVVTMRVKNRTPWLIPYDPDEYSERIPLVNADVDLGLTEVSDVAAPIGGSPVLITQQLGGFVGTCEAELANDVVPGFNAEQMLVDYLWMRKHPHVWLLYADQTIECYIYNCTFNPIPLPDGRTDYTIEFNFLQVGLA